MKSRFARLGMYLGGLYALLGSIRWYVFFPDFDKAVTSGLIGLSIVAISWIYGELMKLKLETMAMGDYLEDLK